MRVRKFKNMLFHPQSVSLVDDSFSVGGRGTFEVRDDQVTNELSILEKMQKIKMVGERHVDEIAPKQVEAPVPESVTVESPDIERIPVAEPVVEDNDTQPEPTPEVNEAEVEVSEEEKDNDSLTNDVESVESIDETNVSDSAKKKKIRKKSQRR